VVLYNQWGAVDFENVTVQGILFNCPISLQMLGKKCNTDFRADMHLVEGNTNAYVFYLFDNVPHSIHKAHIQNIGERAFLSCHYTQSDFILF
jgi:hypothetical protein